MKKPIETQGRSLAFIYYYTKVHRVPPAVVTFEANGFIERIPGQPRTTRVLLPREEIPELE